METWDLDWITPGLAVGGAFPVARAAALAEEHRIGAVVDLRAEDRDDETEIRRCGMDFLHLPTDDHCAVALDRLDRGVGFVRRHLEAGAKVLVHCEHGIGRSALLALCVLVDQGLEPMHALELAKDRRALISPSAAQHAGWCAWLSSRGIEAPDYHAFGCVAYRHLREA